MRTFKSTIYVELPFHRSRDSNLFHFYFVLVKNQISSFAVSVESRWKRYGLKWIFRLSVHSELSTFVCCAFDCETQFLFEWKLEKFIAFDDVYDSDSCMLATCWMTIIFCWWNSRKRFRHDILMAHGTGNRCEWRDPIKDYRWRSPGTYIQFKMSSQKVTATLVVIGF